MTRSRDKALTQDLLLAAARELFAERGWSGVTVRDVAAKAGRRLPSVYDHFGSMEGLWRAAMGCEPPDPVRFAEAVICARPEDVRHLAADFLRAWRGNDQSCLSGFHP